MIKELTRDNKIKLFVIIILVGFFIAISYHYYQGVYKGRPYPANTFLFIPVDRFNDFFNTIKFTDYSPNNFENYSTADYGYAQNSNYLPGTFLVSNFFHAFKAHKHIYSFLLFLVSTILFMFFYSWKNLQTNNRFDTTIYTIVFSFLTYPFLILIDRANFEIVILVLLSLFVYLYQKGKLGLSTLPLALAISMKLYPAVFLILFVSDRKYWQTFFAIALSIGFMIFSLLFLMDGGLFKNFKMMLSALQGYNSAVKGNFGLDFGHSLFGLVKSQLIYFNINTDWLFSIWLIVALIVMSFVALIIVLIEMEFWKKISLILISICLLPYVSPDYKLIHFFIPIFLFINSNVQFGIANKKSKNILNENKLQYLYTLLFSFLLIPKGYRFYFSTINEGVIVNPFLMVFISYLIIYTSICESKKDEILNKIKYILFFFEKKY